MTFTEIKSFARRLTNTDSTTYSDANLTADANTVYDEIISLILASDNRWQFDDKNFTTQPIATTNLNANQQDYEFDTTFLEVRKVLIKDAAGNWSIPLRPFDMDDSPTAWASLQNEATNTGTPFRYDVLASSLFLDPKPNYNSTGGLKVFFQRNGDSFDVADTTKTPGFASLFHKVIPIGTAFYFATYRNLPQRESLNADYEKIKKDITEYFQHRNKDDKPQMRAKYRNPM
jgi:hypothetical protein